jgi:hypothetical protein
MFEKFIAGDEVEFLSQKHLCLSSIDDPVYRTFVAVAKGKLCKGHAENMTYNNYKKRLPDSSVL